MTNKCHKCGKPVYFAERKTSLGKDWHRQCLRCEECQKVLNPGQHAEHKGLPYCHIPCYSALFGPTLLRHGQSSAAHSSFGHMKERSPENTLQRTSMESRIIHYNNGVPANAQLRNKEVNGRLVYEGLLRVYWGLNSAIKLQDKDNIPVSKAETRARQFREKLGNGLDLSDEVLKKLSIDKDAPVPQKTSDDTMVVMRPRKTPRRYNTMACRADRTKRYSINGHLYNKETSVFVPPYGTVTNVRVSNSMTTVEVIWLLFDRFKVQNKVDGFVMVVCKRSGEIRALRDQDFPLIERVLQGPCEEESKIFLMDRATAKNISDEVAQFVSLPEPVLQGFIEKMLKEEETECNRIKQRYEEYRKQLRQRISELRKGS